MTPDPGGDRGDAVVQALVCGQLACISLLSASTGGQRGVRLFHLDAGHPANSSLTAGLAGVGMSSGLAVSAVLLY
jgi:hypothetical protein